MLNARPDVVRDESRIIAQAGLPGMITVATRMAGRGTDIVLGGNAKGLVEDALYKNILERCIPNVHRSSSMLPSEFDLRNEEMSHVPPSIKGLLMVASARSLATEGSPTNAEDVEALMHDVMQSAENLRLDVLNRLRYQQPPPICY